ncbi:ERF superfamily protein (plasmid) [Nostoc sp. PCC 7524]|uniref:ERF family protein n=1 Tax=Nostoc sp. (strain ATCC 29411 / PCC 7524) TaxID=28072 RepID=UPI00029EF92B|nr:ERF family protein [Nostoc sp. PCC 7524]AFY51356.1 ERF superfamily protein [Nostoc sp. PCC 7524]
MTQTPQLNAALAKAKAQIPAILANRNVKIPTKTGREINFTYAELEEIQPKITPVLSACGLAIAHQMTFVESRYCLVSTLRHESGEQIDSVFPLPGDFNDAKELGIQISYGRRYNTLCLLDITVVDSQNWEEVKRKIGKEIRQEAGLIQKPKEKEGSILHDMAGVSGVQTISEGQIKRLWAIARNELHLSESDVRSVLAGFQLERTADIPTNKYDAVIESMKNYATKF